jgi:hypothetical protein
VTRGTVSPSGAFANLQLCSGCRQSGQFLSCGLPGLRRLSPMTVEPYWLGSPPSLLPHSNLQRSALRCSGRRVERPRCKHLRRSAFRVLGRHFRALPQRLVDELHAVARHLRTAEAERLHKAGGGSPTTSPMEFGSFRRMNPGDRCTGLPHRYHPLSEFLTLSAV